MGRLEGASKRSTGRRGVGGVGLIFRGCHGGCRGVPLRAPAARLLQRPGWFTPDDRNTGVAGTRGEITVFARARARHSTRPSRVVRSTVNDVNGKRFAFSSLLLPSSLPPPSLLFSRSRNRAVVLAVNVFLVPLDLYRQMESLIDPPSLPYLFAVLLSFFFFSTSW